MNIIRTQLGRLASIVGTTVLLSTSAIAVPAGNQREFMHQLIDAFASTDAQQQSLALQRVLTENLTFFGNELYEPTSGDLTKGQKAAIVNAKLWEKFGWPVQLDSITNWDRFVKADWIRLVDRLHAGGLIADANFIKTKLGLLAYFGTAKWDFLLNSAAQMLAGEGAALAPQLYEIVNTGVGDALEKTLKSQLDAIRQKMPDKASLLQGFILYMNQYFVDHGRKIQTAHQLVDRLLLEGRFALEAATEETKENPSAIVTDVRKGGRPTLVRIAYNEERTVDGVVRNTRTEVDADVIYPRCHASYLPCQALYALRGNKGRYAYIVRRSENYELQIYTGIANIATLSPSLLQGKLFVGVSNAIGPVMGRVLQKVTALFDDPEFQEQAKMVQDELDPMDATTVTHRIRASVKLEGTYEFTVPQDTELARLKSRKRFNEKYNEQADATGKIARYSLGTATMADVYQVWVKPTGTGPEQTKTFAVKLRKEGLEAKLAMEKEVIGFVLTHPNADAMVRKQISVILETTEAEMDMEEEAGAQKILEGSRFYNGLTPLALLPDTESQFRISRIMVESVKTPSSTMATINPTEAKRATLQMVAPGKPLKSLLADARKEFLKAMQSLGPQQASIADVRRAANKLMKYRRILQQAYSNWMQAAFIDGIVHGDPHSGNIFVDEEADSDGFLTGRVLITYIDPGGSMAVPSRQIANFTGLLLALNAENAKNVFFYLNAMRRLGNDYQLTQGADDLARKIQSYVSDLWLEEPVVEEQVIPPGGTVPAKAEVVETTLAGTRVRIKKLIQRVAKRDEVVQAPARVLSRPEVLANILFELEFFPNFRVNADIDGFMRAYTIKEVLVDEFFRAEAEAVDRFNLEFCVKHASDEFADDADEFIIINDDMSIVPKLVAGQMSTFRTSVFGSDLRWHFTKIYVQEMVPEYVQEMVPEVPRVPEVIWSLLGKLNATESDSTGAPQGTVENPTESEPSSVTDSETGSPTHLQAQSHSDTRSDIISTED